MNQHLRSILLISAIWVCQIIISCSATNGLTISVVEPAPVYVSPDIKKAGIIDRSLPTEDREKTDQIDRILSIEGKDLDKDGATASVTGLLDELTSSERFTKVKIIEDGEVRNPGRDAFPNALSWNKIQKLCDDNDVELLFVLSYYDTDAKVDYQSNSAGGVSALGVKIPVIEHQATIATLIKTGWRIYDPGSKAILDEFRANEESFLSGKGINPMKAVEAILGRKDDVIRISNNMGHQYASRIFNYRIRVSRDYYVKGTNNFKIGKRRAQTGDWDGAAELWEREVDNPKSKIAGRACYNMAIINEINGDLDAAVEWASRAYTDYNDKLALRYVNTLKKRINKNNRL